MVPRRQLAVLLLAMARLCTLPRHGTNALDQGFPQTVAHQRWFIVFLAVRAAPICRIATASASRRFPPACACSQAQPGGRIDCRDWAAGASAPSTTGPRRRQARLSYRYPFPGPSRPSIGQATGEMPRYAKSHCDAPNPAPSLPENPFSPGICAGSKHTCRPRFTARQDQFAQAGLGAPRNYLAFCCNAAYLPLQIGARALSRRSPGKREAGVSTPAGPDLRSPYRLKLPSSRRVAS